MNSIYDVFTGDLARARTAVIQKVARTPQNLSALDGNFTEHWPQLPFMCDIVVLAIDTPRRLSRDLFAGFLVSDEASRHGRRFRVDKFRRIGEHDRRIVSDGEFYGNGGGGGARVVIDRRLHAAPVTLQEYQSPRSIAQFRQHLLLLEGSMEQRLSWVRKNHAVFHDLVAAHWRGRCAVSDAECDGLLVASHIFPWALSSSTEKTDPENGLLLSVPLDRLFDRGWISFDDAGVMLVSDKLSARTRELFGLPVAGAAIARPLRLSGRMRMYLCRHRQIHRFE